jgi:hypothetical protein
MMKTIVSAVSCVVVALQPVLADADSFPTIPERSLQTIERLPERGSVALETRFIKKSQRIEVDVFDLSSGKEFSWKLPNAVEHAPSDEFWYANNAQHTSWAPIAHQLLVGTSAGIYLIEGNGAYSTLQPQTPGPMRNPLDGMRTYALTADGKRLAYTRRWCTDSEMQG